MEAKHSPARQRAEDAGWSVSARTRQEAQEADACMGADDWLYEAPGPPAAAPPPPTPTQLPTPAPPRPPAH